MIENKMLLFTIVELVEMLNELTLELLRGKANLFMAEKALERILGPTNYAVGLNKGNQDQIQETLNWLEKNSTTIKRAEQVIRDFNKGG